MTKRQKRFMKQQQRLKQWDIRQGCKFLKKGRK